jgi:hypothetical protein
MLAKHRIRKVPWARFPRTEVFKIRNRNFALRSRSVFFADADLKIQFCADCCKQSDCLEIDRRIKNLRNTLLSPLQVSLHLLRILISLRQSGAGSRNTLLSERLQILQFAILRIQETRSVNCQGTESISLGRETYVCACIAKVRSKGRGSNAPVKRSCMYSCISTPLAEEVLSS